MKLNNKILIIFWIILFSRIFFWSPNVIAENADVLSFVKSVNKDKLLKPKLLKIGDIVYLNSYLVIKPSDDSNGYLKLEFDRDDLCEMFIKDIFYDVDNQIYKIHTFRQSGFRMALTETKFILEIFSYMSLHLRNDIEKNTNYKTFKKENTKGKVVDLSGKVIYGHDPVKLKKYYNHIYIADKIGSIHENSDLNTKLPLPVEYERILPKPERQNE